MASAIKTSTAADWRAQLGGKLVMAEEAVGHIKSGDRIALSIAAFV
jgi:hypothetical protein